MELDMLTAGWAIYANRDPWETRLKLWMVAHEPPTYQPALITGFTFELMPEEFHMPPEPTFTLQQSRAQELVNRLWELGIRPAQSRNTGEDAHLRDMRRIAFHQLGIEP